MVVFILNNTYNIASRAAKTSGTKSELVDFPFAICTRAVKVYIRKKGEKKKEAQTGFVHLMRTQG